MADWKYKGESYYLSLRDRLKNYYAAIECDQGVGEAKAVSLYNDLPDIPFDLKIIENGSSISRFSFPIISEEEYSKLIQYEPQANMSFNNFTLSLSWRVIPVKIIFDKTFKIISSGDYLNLEPTNSNVNYDTMINYLFDNNLWPDLPGLSKKEVF